MALHMSAVQNGGCFCRPIFWSPTPTIYRLRPKFGFISSKRRKMPPRPIFGAGGIGTTATSFTYKFDDAKKTTELLDRLKQLNILELDSAASYPPGNPWCAHRLLGESSAAERGFLIHDKIARHMPGPRLDDEHITASLNRSLELLRVERLPVLYAHDPDPLTPLEITAAAFDCQYKAGKFNELGLCNYSVSDLTRYFEICEEHGYVKPTIYQNMYNPIFRKPEKELFPLIRKHNCRYHAYSPLAGGFLTGMPTFATERELYRTRWRGKSIHRAYVRSFDKESVMHDAVRKLKAVCDAAVPQMSLQELSLRWIFNHSALQDGDGIIVGAESIDQIQANISDMYKGPLKEEELEAVESIWAMVESVVIEDSIFIGTLS